MSTVVRSGRQPVNSLYEYKQVDYLNGSLKPKSNCQQMHVTENVPEESVAPVLETNVFKSNLKLISAEKCRCQCNIDTTNEQEIKHEKPQEDYEDLNARLLRALEENIRLRSVIHDVTEVNKRWQKYNQERQGYVQKLLSTIKDLQQKESNTNEISVRAQESATLAETCENLHMEAVTLKNELDNSEKRCRHLNDTLAATRLELNESIELLEMQVKVQAEDFRAERREKMEAINGVDKYKEEIVCLNNKIRELEKEVKQSKVYVCTCQNSYARQSGFCKVAEIQRSQRSSQSRQIQLLPCQFIPRSSSVNGLNPGKSLEELSTDGDSAVSLTSLPNSVQSDSQVPQHNHLKQDRWFLVCPKCKKHYPPNLGLQFSSHIDKCQEIMFRCSQ